MAQSRLQRYLHGDRNGDCPGLLKLAEQNDNDKRYGEYVGLINRLLATIGDERVYLVGSTGENLKLRWSTDSGDADFLMISGRLRVPVENIEQRSDTPRYVWIKGHNLDHRLNGRLIEGRYFPAQLLRTVNPQLFTTLRAIYTIVTAPADFVPGREGRITTIGVNSRVGLARFEFRNLVVERNALPPRCHTRPPGQRSAHVASQLRRRWNGTSIRDNDIRMFSRIVKMVAAARENVSNGQHTGQFGYFAHMMHEALQRRPLSRETGDEEETVTFENDLDVDDDEVITATYEEKSSKDFVPAGVVTGKLQLMRDFKQRMQKAAWPSAAVVEEIWNNDVFIICRSAPLNPTPEKDCCLGFNLSEIKLSQSMPPVAKKVYIILKSYLKGLFYKRHATLDPNLDVRLKSYHAKTALFWTLERFGGEDFWTQSSDEAIIKGIRAVVDFLLACIRTRRLSHFFVVNSNMFDGFKDIDYILSESCLEEIKKDPVGCIECFFEMDRAQKAEIKLTREEYDRLMDLKADGGRTDFVNRLEDCFIDILRGSGDALPGFGGESPLKGAVMAAIDLFIESERKKYGGQNQQSANTKREERQRTAQQPFGGKSNVSQWAGLLNTVLTGGGTKPECSRQVDDFLGGLVQVASLNPEWRPYIDAVGGASGVQNVLRATGTPPIENLADMRAEVERLLACPDSEVEKAQLALKQKLAGYFLSREEV